MRRLNGYDEGRADARRMAERVTPRQREAWARAARFYAGEWWRSRERRAYWLGAARELRA